ncbi:hypothetical protein EPUL_006006, partial [Erysiphe pulchra]
MDLTGDENIKNLPSSNLVMLPTNLWNIQYITHTPEILSSAIKIDPELVSRLFDLRPPPQSPTSATPSPVISNPQQNFRISAPLITPYDGTPKNLRPFCSQLCLGPGALFKMRSSFRCLEDPTVPAEIIVKIPFL